MEKLELDPLKKRYQVEVTSHSGSYYFGSVITNETIEEWARKNAAKVNVVSEHPASDKDVTKLHTVDVRKRK